MGNFVSGFFGGGRPSPTPAPTPFPTGAIPGGGGPPVSDPVVQGVQPNCFETDFSSFNICLDLDLSNDNRLAAFQNARDAWESVITGQENTRRNFNNFMRSVGRRGQEYASSPNELPTTLDDVYIAGFEQRIDGRGGVLGFAGPDFIYDNTGLTLSGSMFFDSADIESLLRSDPEFWVNIVEHEMGHVLGIGTLWESTGVVTQFRQNGRISYRYNGKNAQREWSNICGDTPLPIETDGGDGTAGGHWDEQCLRNELMTGFLSSDNPLSSITVATLEDLGYDVDYRSAEPFSSRDVSRSCCDRQRALRDSTEPKFLDLLPEIGLDLIQRAAVEAFRVLSTLRREAPAFVPEGVKYVGGDRVTVFVLDGEGNVRDVSFRWEDIKDMF